LRLRKRMGANASHPFSIYLVLVKLLNKRYQLPSGAPVILNPPFHLSIYLKCVITMFFNTFIQLNYPTSGGPVNLASLISCQNLL
jgi:hypothetical protein